jgi:hypothetical protein
MSRARASDFEHLADIHAKLHAPLTFSRALRSSLLPQKPTRAYADGRRERKPRRGPRSLDNWIAQANTTLGIASIEYTATIRVRTHAY